MPETAVVIVAHPDDETFCSGLICELVERGKDVEVICLTRGEGGPTNGMPREKLGEAREKEMRCSCEALGVSKVTFLDYIDPVAKKFRVYAPDESPKGLSLVISQLIHNSYADWIVTHGSSGEYWHPAHLLVYRALEEYFGRNTHSEMRWISFCADQPDPPIPRIVNRDDAPYLSLDVSRHAEKRTVALECHASQLSLFGRFAKGSYHEFIQKTSIEHYCFQREIL